MLNQTTVKSKFLLFWTFLSLFLVSLTVFAATDLTSAVAEMAVLVEAAVAPAFALVVTVLGFLLGPKLLIKIFRMAFGG